MKNGWKKEKLTSKDKLAWVIAAAIVCTLVLGLMWVIPLWTLTSVAMFTPFEFTLTDYTWTHMFSFWWLVCVAIFVRVLCE